MSLGDLIEKFRAVALERVEKMNLLLVELEREASSAGIEELTREIHTLKGEAKMMGFADVNLVSHLTEHLMLDAAKASFEVEADKTQVMFEGLDVLRSLLTKTAGGAQAPIDLAGFVDRVAVARGAGQAATFGERPATFKQRAPQETPVLRVQAGGSMRVDFEKLERLGEVAGEVLLASRRLEYQLGRMEQLRGEYQRLRDSVEPLLPKVRSFETRHFAHSLDVALADLRASVAQAGQWASNLDGHTRDLRHVPLDQALQQYPRAVRDLATSQNKQVRFDLNVAGVEVDRVILNSLSDPLLHLIRNAVDHGLETPEERMKGGKESEGTLTLDADYAGDSVRVVLSDDGRGIDPDYVARKAVERGVIGEAEAARLDRDERMALIFEPGFSTRDEVTDVSGRGIGMDVVRRQIGIIGGTVELESIVGQGSTFTLVLPISSAIHTVLLVAMGADEFAVPAKDVERVLFVSSEDLESRDGILHVRHDEQLVPLLEWRRVLGEEAPEVPRGRVTVLIVSRGGRAVAVWVDRVIGEHEAITRPLGEFLAGIRVCRGIAITDVGVVVPVLNVNELLSVENLATSIGGPQRMRATMELRRIPESRTILIVEDSEITRALVTEILQGYGYRVIEAEDGYEGWNQLENQRVHLVLSDVQMPRMSGLSLLEKIRADERFKDLPVVILTTLGEAADKERAMNLGADGYLVKLNFQEKELLQTIRRFLD